MIDYNVIFEKKIVKQGDFPECYAFSLHKAGSTLMHKMIDEVCRLANIPGLNIPSILFKEGVFDKVWENDERILDMITPGKVYYGFRMLPSIFLHESLRLREKKIVLLIRDPRDALVSQFYSYGGKNVSHKLPGKNQDAFLKQVQNTAHMEIDQYVLSAAATYRNKLNVYKDQLNFENVMLFKYEDIFFDKRKFLGDIFMHFGIPVESCLLDEIATRNDVRPEMEDITKHIRKGLPGDHVNKLMPETISKLNTLFSETCAWYGYDLS